MVPAGGDWDEALERLEDFVAAYPLDRALPDLDDIAARARLPRDFLREDERAVKVLHEAIGSRPLSDIEHVAQLRTEVELLTVEVEVLSERIASRAATGRELRRAVRRLAVVRRRLDEVHRHL